MTRYIITHIDKDGEAHQLTGAWEASSPQEAIAKMLSEAQAEDDGGYDAWIVKSEKDILGPDDVTGAEAEELAKYWGEE